MYELTKNIKYNNTILDSHILDNNETIYIYKLYISIFFIIFFIKNKNYQQNSNLLNYITNEFYNIFIFKSNNLITEHNIRKYVFRFISYIEIHFNKIKIKKIIKNKKSIKFFLFELEKDDWMLDKKISKIMYTLHEYNNNYYLHTGHFTTLSKIYKENINSLYNFNMNDLSLLKKLINNYAYIDKQLYKNLLDIQLKYHNLNNKEELLKTITIYNKNFNYLNESNKSLLSKYNSIKDKFDFIDNYVENTKIFFSFSFDFRGRLYFDSSNSPTNCKITRNSIHYGVYENNVNNQNSKTYKIITNYIHYVDKNINIENKIAILWYYISIGKLLIKKNKEFININEFILAGKEWYHQNENELNISPDLPLDHQLEIYKYYYTIKNIFNNILLKYTISKDATASGLQHLLKILKPYNEESLKYCNLLSEDTWYDTYSHIINIFFNNNNIDSNFKQYFNRKSTKKTLMIENYGATKTKCYKDFISNIKFTNSADIPKIKIIFNKLYDQLKENKISNFYKNNFSIILQSDEYIYPLNDGCVNLSYNKTIKHQLSVIYKKKRNTFQEILTTNIIDKKKSKKAFKANITHTSDAEICRRMYFLYNDSLFSVHDCFIINIYNVNTFIDLINEEMRKSAFKNKKFLEDIEYNTYSIFIII